MICSPERCLGDLSKGGCIGTFLGENGPIILGRSCLGRPALGDLEGFDGDGVGVAAGGEHGE